MLPEKENPFVLKFPMAGQYSKVLMLSFSSPRPMEQQPIPAVSNAA
jgi:hypothetical protein